MTERVHRAAALWILLAVVWFGLSEDQHPLFAFAGIWRPGDEGPFMAILTCEANATVGAVHPKAMPVMLRPGDVPCHRRDLQPVEQRS